MNDTTLHGLVELTNEAYHAGPGISKSKLDAVAVSPLNYWDKYINPDREPEDLKHCFAVGDGTHKLVLEPGTFEQTYAVGFDRTAFPEALDTVDALKQALMAENLMTSGAKPELARRLVEEAGYPRERILMFLKQDHDAKMAGKIDIPARDYKGMLGMLSAVHRHHTAGGLLSGAMVEQSFFWTDEVGVLRKCRTDAISHNGEWVVDLKTTDDVSLAGFGRTIANRRYHVQAAWYLDILHALYGRDAPRGFAFVAAQKNRPHDVAVHWMMRDDEVVEAGRRLYQRDLARISECLGAGYWPGADNGDLLQAQLPYWATRDQEFA